MSYKICFYIVILFNFLFNVKAFLELSDYKNHICNRNCDLDLSPKLCEYNFTLEWYTTLSKACYDCPMNITDCYRADCVAANGIVRAIMVVNRMLPGPAIQVCKGDVVSIRVHNNMHHSEASSIHWHGITQKGTPYMDGVSMVTQCPILPHSSFEYRFRVNDIGTHFWHAHSGLQRQDGIFGAFIVKSSSKENVHSSLYDFDLSEHIIIVNEWLNVTSIEKFIQHQHNSGDNKPDAILINGRGLYYEYQTSLKNITETPRATFSVKKGYRYRFRLINAGSLYCPITVSIDNHNITVIASDGNDLEPNEVQSLTIFAGERYDFILNANQIEKNYWIRTKGFADCSVKSVYQTALLIYQDQLLNSIPLSTPFNYTTMDRSGILMNPWNLKVDNSNRNYSIQIDNVKSKNLDTSVYNETVNKKFYLSMEFNKIDNEEFQNRYLYPLSQTSSKKRIFTPQINNISMMIPPVPPLYQWDDVPKDLICNQENKEKVCPPSKGDYCSCIHVYEIDLNDLVELIIVDEGFTFQSNHPMHLHGHTFAVVGIDKLNRSISTSTIIEMDKNGLLRRNLDRPPVKDTVTVPVGGYTIIRFYANNPGAWLFHCHLEFHSEVGMVLLFKVGNKNDLPKEPPGWPKCGPFIQTRSSILPENEPLIDINSSNKISSKKFILTIFSILFFFNYFLIKY